ncbi:MAG: caspase family protein, partial [Rhizonema sp. NSF051]|nr:caspase family protein [Rhizonema sp. NSF051]
MAYQTNQTPNLYALLIGIDCYLPNQLPDGSYYKSLSGCVRDITHVEAFLKNTLKVSEQRILKLTASNTGASQPPESPTQWPTYENMVMKFKELTQKAQPGEQVYIHYSGHGGRPETIYRKLKGDDGIDEALVPMDIGDSTARYLRDLELAKLLKEMVDKKLVVTLVLDSCHSGGATRGGDSDIRGLDNNVVDRTTRNTESLVASYNELETNWLALTGGNARKLSASGWLPESNDYVLLAACRQNESAYEYAFDGKQRNGALTYWLLDTLEQLGAGNSYKVLHDRIFAKVHSKFQQQTPMLQGTGNRVVFGSDRVSLEYTATVLQVDLENKQVKLDVGQVHGLRKGAEFAIYSLGTTDFNTARLRDKGGKIKDFLFAYKTR